MASCAFVSLCVLSLAVQRGSCVRCWQRQVLLPAGQPPLSHVVEKTGLGGLMVMEEVNKNILIGFYRLNLLPVL